MSLTRRTIGKILGAALATPAGVNIALAQRKPRLGMIFPVIDRGVPEEGLTLYGDKIDYVIENLDLQTMTPDGYDAVIGNIPEKARSLAEQDVDAIMIMGTSLTFYQGREFNERITE